MQKYFASFESILHRLADGPSWEILATGAITFVALLSFSIFKIYVKFSRSGKASTVTAKGHNGDLPALTCKSKDTSEGLELASVPSAAQAFAKDLAASASEKDVPLAPLQTVLGCLIEGGISERTILSVCSPRQDNWRNCAQNSPPANSGAPGLRKQVPTPWP
jgi:hypothetical protein